MSTETTTQTAEVKKPEVQLPPIPPTTITRNEVLIEFVIQIDAKGAGEKNPYLAPDPKKDLPSLADTIKWVGNDPWINSKIWSPIRKLLKSAYEEAAKTAEGADGVFNLEKFNNVYAAALAEMKFYAESIKKLRERKDELTAQAVELATSGDPESSVKIAELLAQVGALAKAIEAKSRSHDDDDEAEVTPAAA